MKQTCSSSRASSFRAYGFTLVEMMVALAVGGAVVAIGANAVAMIQKQTILVARTVEVENHAKVLTEYMVSQAQGIGGGFLRPWGAVAVVENDASGDELYLFDVDGLMECAISSQAGQNIKLDDDSSCACLGTPSDWVGRDVIIMNKDEDEWMTATVTNANNSSCDLTFNKGASVGNATFNGAFKSDGSWSGGGVVAVNSRRFFLNTSDDTLRMSENGGADVIIAPDVFDLQVSMGWDGDPQDGICFQDGSASDEWIGNHPGDPNNTADLNKPNGSATTGGLKRPANTNYKDLRQLEIGLVVGVKAGRTQPAQVLDGATKTKDKYYMRATTGRVTFRNANIYQ